MILLPFPRKATDYFLLNTYLSYLCIFYPCYNLFHFSFFLSSSLSCMYFPSFPGGGGVFIYIYIYTPGHMYSIWTCFKHIYTVGTGKILKFVPNIYRIFSTNCLEARCLPSYAVGFLVNYSRIFHQPPSQPIFHSSLKFITFLPSKFCYSFGTFFSQNTKISPFLT